jgi:hypothetical protein
VRLQMGRIDHHHLGVLRLCGQFGHDGGEHAHAAPSLPAVVEGLRRTVVTWRMLPHQPVALYVDYPAQHPPIINPRFATRLRKERPEPLDLRLGQPEQIAHDRSHLWELESRREPSLKQIYRS